MVCCDREPAAGKYSETPVLSAFTCKSLLCNGLRETGRFANRPVFYANVDLEAEDPETSLLWLGPTYVNWALERDSAFRVWERDGDLVNRQHSVLPTVRSSTACANLNAPSRKPSRQTDRQRLLGGTIRRSGKMKATLHAASHHKPGCLLSAF